MSSSTITIKDHNDVDNIFSLQGTSSNESKYIDPDSSLAAPLGFSVKFNTPPIGSKANDRCIVSFYDVIIQTDNTPAVGSIKCEISVPRSGDWTEDQTRALAAYVRNYLTDARVQLLVDGITP